MPRVPQVSDAEWEVMQLLWDRAPQTSAEIIESLAKRKDWNDRTIKTLLSRLVKKGALSFEAEGKRYLYQPRVAREDCVRSESKSFLSRVFRDRAGEMLCKFVDEVELSPDEINQLRKLLDRKRR